MRVFTLVLILTLTLGFLTTAESGYPIPKIFKGLLVFQEEWDVIGPVIEKQIPQYVQGLLDALKAIMSPEKIEAAVFQNLEKVTSSAVYSADKEANALRFGVKVGGKPVEIGIELIATEMGVAVQVEGVSAVESAIIGITEEEAASVLAVLLVG
ncbi:unnamed protein product [Rhizophagus irregularis]|uniref:Uncharacterized protein n=1 Tax=Rhizophagus irregularis TaxID=588596 RepID=A0A2N1MK64_9GLOM|nr:hypothetical protein RhiirC2_790968 [Rhizophagus irregularis]CAB4390887.1 unnamed protein product [Rhizophagus irregularis]CAB5385500.1 unnamed protein product [Rhizophagus irregularis]